VITVILFLSAISNRIALLLVHNVMLFELFTSRKIGVVGHMAVSACYVYKMLPKIYS